MKDFVVCLLMTLSYLTCIVQIESGHGNYVSYFGLAIKPSRSFFPTGPQTRSMDKQSVRSYPGDRDSLRSGRRSRRGDDSSSGYSDNERRYRRLVVYIQTKSAAIFFQSFSAALKWKNNGIFPSPCLSFSLSYGKKIHPMFF